MSSTEDIVARGARVVRAGENFRWPGRRRVAVVLNVAYEAWSDGKAPGVGPMGNPLPAGAFDTNALSWGAYGAQQGIDRLLRVLDRTKQRASVMISGVLAEREPARVRAIAHAGHEIVAHGYAQETVPATLSPEQDRANISRTTELLETATGSRPRGWFSPRGTPARDTARLLVEAGYAWQGDAFDDDRPYLQVFGEQQIVAIPLTMEINDLPHAMRFGRSPRQFVELFDDALAQARGGDRAIMIDVTAHTHVYGRPSGAAAYEEIAQKLREHDDVWTTTRAEIAEHARAAISSVIPAEPRSGESRNP
jgi:peptidoglycan/xylan/chitin deacetylase (PgdA/CDA1 family)